MVTNMQSIATRFTEILGRLRQAVAIFANRQAQKPLVVSLGSQTYVELTPPSPHATIPMATWFLLTEHLGRLAQRFRAVVARLEAGYPANPRPSRIRSGPRPTAPRLPTARGWINARVPDAAPCAGTLLILLQDPAMPEFVARAPQAGRLLRPICRALAVDIPDWLRHPPAVIPSAAKDPRCPPGRPKPKPRATPQASALPPRPALPNWYPLPPRTRQSRP